MSECWNPRKIITNLTKEEFKEWCIENKENLQYYIDSLDDTTYGQFEKWIISQYDLRTWNTLIDSMGNPECKRPGRSLSYNHLVGKPKIGNATKQEYILDKVVLGSGAGISVADPVVTTDPVTGKKTTTIKISAEGLADGNVGYDDTDKKLQYKKDGVYTPIKEINLDGTNVKENLNNKIDLLGDVPGWAPGTQPYRLPYFFETSGDANKVTVTAKTITLDNKKDQGTASLDVNSATTTKAGLMSAADKTKLDGIDTTGLATKAELTAEKTRAETAEDALETYCDNLDATKAAQTDLALTNANLASEVTARQGADTTLTNSVNTLAVKIEGLPDGTTIQWTDATKTTLKAIIPNVLKLKGRVDTVAELPATGNDGDVYFVGLTSAENADMYCWIDASTSASKWTKIGTTTIDLSAYETIAHASSTYQTLANKSTSLTSASTDETYPTSKTVYDYGKELLKIWLPVGAIWSTTNASHNPATILGFGTWQLISDGQYIPNLPNVFGNGKTLGVATKVDNNIYPKGFASFNTGGGDKRFAPCVNVGAEVNDNGNATFSGTNNGAIIGVLKKDWLTSTTYDNTGITLDTTQVYMWKRTA